MATSSDDKPNGNEQDDVSFLRTEDYICLNCAVTNQNGQSRRMALAAEAFGNKMCFLEDISVEYVSPDLPACLFVLEQALSVRALQEVVNTTNNGDTRVSSSQLTSGYKTLLYGHAVLLRHAQSNMYLTCLSTSSSNDKLAFDVGLQCQSNGESCWWTIHPASKQRSEGEKVRIGDDFILVSVASERYLHIYLLENNISRVNASFQQTLWTLAPISSGNVRIKNPGFVYGGDVLRLFHGNMDQCFTLPQAGTSEYPYSIFYESGAVFNHARSLWRLEHIKTRWYGGFMGWNCCVRLRHITSGRYLGVVNGEVTVLHRGKTTADAITFILTASKDEKRSSEIEQEESMGHATIKYGDTLVYIQHLKSNCWLSYRTYETKKRGVGKVEEQIASLSAEGHMDDCFTIVRAQEEESRSALVIRKCLSLFTKFNYAMENNVPSQASESNLKGKKSKISLEQVNTCLDDLIEFFAQPNDNCSHEERQSKLKALHNRQDLFHEEGMISLVLDTIDKYSDSKSGLSKSKSQSSISFFDNASQQMIDDIYDKLYVLLATMIKGNRNNCSQFAQGNRLDCLIGRLTSQQASRGVLEVLHCVLIDSPEALNMIKERHIQGIISLLDRNGRDPKVLDVLCSLCANNGIAVRTNQNLICENLLPRRDLILQTRLIDQISCTRPNIMVGVEEGESMYKKWYFEVEIDYCERPNGSDRVPHCRIGWATTEFQPTSDGADGLTCIGVGDDMHSYGFDGINLWYAGRTKQINSGDAFEGFKKGDVIGCLLDLSIPEIWFSLNGLPMKGFFREFNLSGMFYPVVSLSPKISCRFLFGDDNGRFKYGPPEGCAPICQAMLSRQKLKIEQCFSFGDMNKNIYCGPPALHEHIAFTPSPVDTSSVQVPGYFETIRDKLAENMHEIWSMYKIEQGWRFAEQRNDTKKSHNCLCQFEMLPREEKQYDLNLSMETLKTLSALGYEVIIDTKQEQKRSKYLKLSNTFLQSNGYKPQPLDLSIITLNTKLEELVEKLAENTHNVWAKERIRNGWTYGVSENQAQKRHPYLLPYEKVDEAIKKANRETAFDTVKTLLAYGYVIEPPSHDVEELIRKRLSGSKSKDLSQYIPEARTYRAEATLAVTSGKWYYEVEVLTSGLVKLGWSTIDCTASCEIGLDPKTFSYDGYNARKNNVTSEAFGKKWSVGDIIGVMIDLQHKTISFSINGELILDSVGNECAFKNLELNEGYVPSFSLGTSQKIRLNFGQDVNSLKFFTNCGLQEGYEPFCVNMTRQISLWYTKELPLFTAIDVDHGRLEVARLNPSQDTPPCIKVLSKTFGNTEKTSMEFLRLSLPVTFHDEYLSKSNITERRMNALNVYKSQLEEEAEQHHQIFNFDTAESHFQSQPEIEKASVSNNFLDPSTASQVTSQGSKPLGGLLNRLPINKMRPKSPFKFMNKLSVRESSPTTQSSTVTQKRNKTPKSKFSRSSEFGINKLQAVQITTTAATANQSQLNVKNQAQNERGTSAQRKQQQQAEEEHDVAQRNLESDDMELQAIMDYVDEYYYGVRIFPGQDPSNIFVGWTTARFHLSNARMNKPFNSKSISQCALISTDADGSIVSNLVRKSCYMISAAELVQFAMDSDVNSSKRMNNGLLIGCIVDLSTGFLSFCVNGKEAPQKFYVEPGTRLYPAVFFEATTKEVLQFELGRIKNCLPLSAALFPSLGKHIIPRCPLRLKLQSLSPFRWSRVPNQVLKVHTLKMNNILGWSMLCEEVVNSAAIYIPEEDRWINILELNENVEMLKFHHNMLLLYQAVCAQGNNFVAHEVFKHIDEAQLMYFIQNQYLSGYLRTGFHDLLIKLHLETHATSLKLTNNEFIIPLTEKLEENKLSNHEELIRDGLFPNKNDFVSVRPSIIQEDDIRNESQRLILVPPKINISKVKQYVMNSLQDAVKIGFTQIRDPIGGSNANLLVPLIKLANNLLIMDLFEEQDLKLLMSLLEPTMFACGMSFEEGLLNMKLDSAINLELCRLLHSICDYILRYRIESIISFGVEFVASLQTDQKKRYLELKEAVLPSAIMARKTKEFRCPAFDQMKSLVNFKLNSNVELSDEIKDGLQGFCEKLNKITRIKPKNEGEENKAEVEETKNALSNIFQVLFTSNYDVVPQQEVRDESALEQAEEKALLDHQLSVAISKTIIQWARDTMIIDQTLINEMFTLIFRQYNSIGEISDSLKKTYVIGEKSINDVKLLLQSLGTVRGLLCVQMSPSEEEIMKNSLNEIMNNKVFFQHPDLMRSLCVHETIMQVMINWLNRRQSQQDMSVDLVNAGQEVQASNQMSQPADGTSLAKEENAELVVVCCKFLSYFCRTSRHNQRAMFEHLSYLLDNSGMLLARPSLRGSCPLDVACSSLMDNNDLSLALRESHLEKITQYLSRCGLQTNAELYAKGYPDIGWDPVEGERFLDFLKFCVWVNGDSVEENANLVVRLLIRKPECLGPALRGEGGGLFKATVDGIRMSLQIAATQNQQNPVILSAILDSESESSIDFLNNNKFDFSRIPSEEDEDYIDNGGAILSFYASLVELLGRCAPSEETIKMGKPDSIRARSILRSLVSMEDLEGVLGIRFILPVPNPTSDCIPGLQPSHKMSIIIFLERVYGIPDQNTFFRLIENAFLPDLRTASVLDASSCSETEMALALNRYVCCSILPLLTSYAYYFEECDYKAILVDALLHTIYRLTKCKSLTTGQLVTVCEFLIALTNQLKPHMMKTLLRKLVNDLPTLSEKTIVPLKMLTIWYERCGKYYSSVPGMGSGASEEEKRLTMLLFTRIFDALAKRSYDPELFSKALPCLSAIGCALSPDYAQILSSQDQNNMWNSMDLRKVASASADQSVNNDLYEPNPVNTSSITMNSEFDEIIRNYAEHVHEYWCYNKFECGWSYGDAYDDVLKKHPMIKPYTSLTKKEQLKYEDLIRETLKVIKSLNWSIDKADVGAQKQLAKLIPKKIKEKEIVNGYCPKPFDLSSITLTRELINLADLLAVNCHELWAQRKRADLDNLGAALHHLLVPYDLLTDIEKNGDIQFAQDFIKFLQMNGHRLQRIHSGEDLDNFNNSNSNEIRFAYNLLEKLLQYVDKAALHMQSIKESSKFSRKETFKTSGEDVKFFTKVVLPLVERYFQSHRAYFLLKSDNDKNTQGFASAKEKEMTCSLFCRLAGLIRLKLSSFGSDSKITVKCLQVLIQAVDINSVMKNSPEIARSQLLPFFSHAADDLNNVIYDLQSCKLSNLKGTSQKGTANLNYMHMVLLPVLASMFDHLGVNKYGRDVLVKDIQVASYKILNALWILGSYGNKLIDRAWIVEEMNRFRSLIGECLGSFASCFPIAFLEPQFNVSNKNSIMYGLSASNLSEHSLEGQDVMNKILSNMPLLENLIDELRDLSESNGKSDSAYVTEVLLPTLCSYLNYWWHHGPSARKQHEQHQKFEKGKSVDPADRTPPPSQMVVKSQTKTAQQSQATDKREELITNVTSSQMNEVLGYILKLIYNNIDEPNAPWMNRIASFSQSIISNSTPDLLEKHFLPVAVKVLDMVRSVCDREVSMKITSRNIDTDEREKIENELQKDFELLVRNVYAFYPLLIKYVDLHRTYWLKNLDPYAEQLYSNVSEVFAIWLKSKMFKREEANFVSSNDIDNTTLIMPTESSQENPSSGQNGGSPGTDALTTLQRTRKFNSNVGAHKHKKKGKMANKFTSLVVASMKRLFQIGINFFGGSEQELIQMAKQKFVEIKLNGSGASNNSSIKGSSGQNKPSGANDSSSDDSDLELTKEQEEMVEEFVRSYLRSPDYLESTQHTHQNSIQNGGSESNQRHKWQRMLYRKIGSKRHLMQNLSEDEIVERLMKISKVLFGLHVVEHPRPKAHGVWRKLISSQRKRAVMACFRMAPLYSMPLHRAINLFLKPFKENWLDNEEEIERDIGSLIPDLCTQGENENSDEIKSDETPEMAKVDEQKETVEMANEVESSETSTQPDPLRQLISSFNRVATTEQTNNNKISSTADENQFNTLYLSYAEIMSKSIFVEDDDDEEEVDDGDEAGGEEEVEEDQAKMFQEAELMKQKLLFEQGRLLERGAAEMALLYISASKGERTEMLEKTLQLGISLLHGGNIDVQSRMLAHLKDKKDVGFFTSITGLMANCSVLNLDTFERCIKAEAFGGILSMEGGSGVVGNKSLHDADFTCSLFRFLQLLCEGHNLDFQNYLRTQAGNNTTVNLVIAAVDYLLRLQESMMDFYWYYSGKSTVDAAGRDNFCRAITVASQVFNTLTEYIQGPCVGNQLTLANSRLWDAISGFLYIFAHFQEKLSKDPQQMTLLKELMNLQKDMIIMLLSMLEGNVMNGAIGKQMVDTLIENQQNVEMLLKFFDIFLKMKDLTDSETFQEFDLNQDGFISPKEFKKAMEAQKVYSSEEIEYVLMCVDTNQDNKIDFKEFTERFHNPAKDIGFNMAVLLTNLNEHMSFDARFDRLMKKASSFLSYFEPFLGRIEITGSSGKIERVYFEIPESNIEQWNKPQIKDSKRQFLYDIVNEGDDKEKLEQFVNFCEDTIFEMQHATSISSESEAPRTSSTGNSVSLRKVITDGAFSLVATIFYHLSPSQLKHYYTTARSMSLADFAKTSLGLLLKLGVFSMKCSFYLVKTSIKCVYVMMTGQHEAKEVAHRDHTLETPQKFLAIEHKASKADEELKVSDESVKETIEKHQESLHRDQNQVATTVAGEINAQEHQRPEGMVEPEHEESSSPYEHTGSKSKNSLTKNIAELFARNFYKLKYLALILAFLINFMMLFYKASVLDANSDGGDDTANLSGGEEDEMEPLEIVMIDPDKYYLEYVMGALAFIHSCVAFSIMVAYYVLKVPLVIFKREKEIARKLEFEGMWIVEQPSEDDLRSHWDKLVINTPTFPEMYWDKFVKKKVKAKYADQFDVEQLCKLLGMNSNNQSFKFDMSKDKKHDAQATKQTSLLERFKAIDWYYHIWKWGVIFTDNSFLYIFWYFLFSVIGNFNYFFFACHLVDVAISIKALTTILKSITHNGKQLLLTIMLMSIIVYMYTVIAFNFFRKFYSSEEDGEVEQNCQDLFTCFKFHLYMGIRSGGGIGDELESPVGDSMEFYRIIFDITFFFFIIVILLAIIQGLIIDAFGELRDQLEQVKETLESECFICGIGNDYFDKTPHGFETHTMNEHNFANYMFFLMHLINKPNTEYTGQETYVWQLYQQRCWDFFPVGDCFRKQHDSEAHDE